MLAYRHLFHAGNFADVFKHALLTRVLIALGKKPKPYCYLDTHAGIGRYDLAHEWARKNAEFADRHRTPAGRVPTCPRRSRPTWTWCAPRIRTAACASIPARR